MLWFSSYNYNIIWNIFQLSVSCAGFDQFVSLALCVCKCASVCLVNRIHVYGKTCSGARARTYHAKRTVSFYVFCVFFFWFLIFRFSKVAKHRVRKKNLKAKTNHPMEPNANLYETKCFLLSWFDRPPSASNPLASLLSMAWHSTAQLQINSFVMAISICACRVFYSFLSFSSFSLRLLLCNEAFFGWSLYYILSVCQYISMYSIYIYDTYNM